MMAKTIASGSTSVQVVTEVEKEVRTTSNTIRTLCKISLILPPPIYRMLLYFNFTSPRLISKCNGRKVWWIMNSWGRRVPNVRSEIVTFKYCV